MFRPPSESIDLDLCTTLRRGEEAMLSNGPGASPSVRLSAVGRLAIRA